MGLVQLPSFVDYWSKAKTFRYTKIADKISRDRFLLTIQSWTRTLQQVQPVIDSINNSLQVEYELNKEITVDEAMIPFKGRSSLKQ